jgi:hypothetical protein
MNCQTLVFSSHAIQQMFFRRITKQSVRMVITYGTIIEENLDDQPFPSYLILDFMEGKPIHVVLSYNKLTDTGYVVTAYIPSPDLWTNNYQKRR